MQFYHADNVWTQFGILASVWKQMDWGVNFAFDIDLLSGHGFIVISPLPDKTEIEWPTLWGSDED